MITVAPVSFMKNNYKIVNRETFRLEFIINETSGLTL